LRKLSWSLLKQCRRLEAAARVDPGLAEVFRKVDEAWTLTYRLAGQRELAEARRDDKGEVLWTLFFPREYYGEQQPCITRTPNLRSERRYLEGEHLRLAVPAAAWSDLAESWKPADPNVMANRKERVDRDLKAWLEREAA
jgi:hypothetical protein